MHNVYLCYVGMPSGVYGTGTGGFGMMAAPPTAVSNGGPPAGMPPPPSYGKYLVLTQLFALIYM